jgi:hypothetical protein
MVVPTATANYRLDHHFRQLRRLDLGLCQFAGFN